MKITKNVIALLMVINVIFCGGISVYAAESVSTSDAMIVTTQGYNPFGDSSDARSIIGDDNRTLVSNKTVYPYSAIAYVISEFPCGCSTYRNGFMVSQNCMLTAGHCTVCSEHGNNVSTITAYFGYQSNSNYLAKVVATPSNAIIYHDPSFTGTEKNYDYGYVVFSSNVGNTTGWFGLAARSDSNLDGMNIAVAAYDYGAMYRGTGTVTSVATNRIKYDADTDGNSSGAPVYGTDGSYSDKVVAIHTMGTDLLNWKNSGWRITSAFINELRSLGYVS